MAAERLSQERLQQVSLFSDLDREMLDALLSVSLAVDFSRNETILHESDDGTSLFVILSGSVKVCLMRPDGKEAILAQLGQGEFFGEMALLDNRPRSASVVALEATQVMMLTRSDFMQLLQRKPQIIRKMLVTLATRLRNADQKIADLAFLDAIGRVSRVICQIAEESGEETDEGVVIRNRPSHEHIGRMAATTRETVTHCLTTLERRGYILSDGRDLMLFSISDLRRDFLVGR